MRLTDAGGAPDQSVPFEVTAPHRRERYKKNARGRVHGDSTRIGVRAGLAPVVRSSVDVSVVGVRFISLAPAAGLSSPD